MLVSFLPAIFLGSASFAFLNFGLPIYADEIGLDAVMIGGTYATFMGTIVVVRPLIGIALDRMGRRWFFVLAFAFYVAAMAVFAQTEGVTGLYVARFLQGLGASFMWVTARTMVADLNDDTTAALRWTPDYDVGTRQPGWCLLRIYTAWIHALAGRLGLIAFCWLTPC